MLPDSILHKQNGHREVPRRRPAPAAELLGLSHSAPGHAADVSLDLLKFAVIVQSERPDPGRAGVAGDVSALPEALARAVTCGRDALERGALSDVRAALDVLQAQAELTARVVGQLMDAVRGDGTASYEPAAACRLNVNDLVVEALAALRAGLPAGTALSTDLDPDLPPVDGDARLLREVLTTVLGALTRARTPAHLAIGTSQRLGVLRGEQIVRVSMMQLAAGVPAPDAEYGLDAATRIGLYRASRIAGEHGGVLSAASLAAGGLRFVLELPSS